MSKKFYNTFGELVELETFTSTTNQTCTNPVTALKNKYRDWIPRNEKEKIAVHSLRLKDEALQKVKLSVGDVAKARENNITDSEAKQAKYFKFSFEQAKQLVTIDIELPIAYLGTKVGFNINDILRLEDQLIDAIYARRLGISVEKILATLDDETTIADLINEIRLPKRRTNDGLRLAGNLEMDGVIKASAFYLSDGSIIEEVPKLAFPENVYYSNSKIGINEKNPKASLDIAGNLDVDKDITCTELLTKKIKSSYNSSTLVNSDIQNTMQFNVKNPKNDVNQAGLGTHFNWKNSGENYIRGKTEFQGLVNFIGPGQLNIENPTNTDNPSGKLTHFNFENKGQNYIRGKTEMNGEVNFVGPTRINIENDRTSSNPSGLSTHFNYKNKGENYIRGKTEIKGNTDIMGKLCVYDNASNNPICIDANFVSNFTNVQNSNNELKNKIENMETEIKNLKEKLTNVQSNLEEGTALSSLYTTQTPQTEKKVFIDRTTIEFNVNSTDDKAIKYNNTKLDEIFASNTFEISTTMKVSTNLDTWRNVYHYGNTNAERAPAMWIYPKNAYKMHFRIRSDKDFNEGLDFEIPNRFRNGNYTITTRISKDKENNNFTITHLVNGENVAEKTITNSKVQSLTNRDLWIKDPWSNRTGFTVNKISFKKIN